MCPTGSRFTQPSWAAPDRPITIVVKHPGCYTYSVGACTASTIYGMCGNADTQLTVSAN